MDQMTSDGAIQPEQLGGMFSQGQIAQMQAESEAIRRRRAAPGVLRLPELLDARRIEYGIPDGAFRAQATFDRVYVYQIADACLTGETYGDTRIVRPQAEQSSSIRRAPRGILVSAGLQALDQLHSHGVQVGHIVNFLQLVPWQIQCDIIEGKSYSVLVMRSSDIIGSEDLADGLRDAYVCRKAVKVMREGQVTTVEHVYQTRDGACLKPQAPYMSEEY